jgi:hypothetical protein
VSDDGPTLGELLAENKTGGGLLALVGVGFYGFVLHRRRRELLELLELRRLQVEREGA